MKDKKYLTCDMCQFYQEKVGVLNGGKIEAKYVCSLTSSEIKNMFIVCENFKLNKEV